MRRHTQMKWSLPFVNFRHLSACPKSPQSADRSFVRVEHRPSAHSSLRLTWTPDSPRSELLTCSQTAVINFNTVRWALNASVAWLRRVSTFDQEPENQLRSCGALSRGLTGHEYVDRRVMPRRIGVLSSHSEEASMPAHRRGNSKNAHPGRDREFERPPNLYARVDRAWGPRCVWRAG